MLVIRATSGFLGHGMTPYTAGTPLSAQARCVAGDTTKGSEEAEKFRTTRPTPEGMYQPNI
ncbi:MAG: hypothetical protein NDI69_13800 [Bacteriovoracaceae bacterium]|nr:hypothetical protein [Bacteriovoracaceae bacterium]